MPIPAFELQRFDVVAIGSSTGGPGLVESIVAGLPADIRVPIIVAQHMPPSFTESFARTLAQSSPLAVFHAEDGLPVVPGTVYVGRGHNHVRVVRQRQGVRLEVNALPTERVYRPSADELFASCAKVYGGKVLGIVMTGIGQDGVVGAQAVVNAGGMVVTQAKSTCVVYGMPRACDEAGLSSANLNPEEIRRTILQLSPMFRSQAAA